MGASSWGLDPGQPEAFLSKQPQLTLSCGHCVPAHDSSSTHPLFICPFGRPFLSTQYNHEALC